MVSADTAELRVLAIHIDYCHSRTQPIRILAEDGTDDVASTLAIYTLSVSREKGVKS